MNDPWFKAEEGERDLRMLKGNRLRLDHVALETGEELVLFAAGGGYFLETTDPDGRVTQLERVEDRIVYSWPTNEDRLLGWYEGPPPEFR